MRRSQTRCNRCCQAVREAQRQLEAADAKVVQKFVELQDAEKAEAALSSRPTEAAQEATATEPDKLLLALGSEFGEDGEAAEAVVLLRAKVAAKAEKAANENKQNDIAQERVAMEVEELERQAEAAKRTADRAEERLQSAKRAKSASSA